ncbi:MAG: type II secretion system protein GspG [Planctomycetota bacterium]
MNRTTRRGMTLVEVLAVVVILGLLASTLAVGFSGSFGKGRREIARTGVALVAGKVELFQLEHGAWPSMDDGIARLGPPNAAPTAAYFLGEDKQVDPWGRTYQLVVPGPDGHPFEVLCLGADGEPGGEGPDADISSVRLRDETP